MLEPAPLPTIGRFPLTRGAGADGAVRLGVADECPARKRGIASALREGGFAIDDVTDPFRWSCEQGLRLLVLGSLSDRDQGHLVADLRCASESLRLVAMVSESSVRVYRELLAAGATGVVHEDAELHEICAVVESALRGRSLFPAHVAQGLASGGWDSGEEVATESEARWLQALADGATVANLAVTEGYSEREMYRLLRGLYARLAVPNRSRAIVYGVRLGIIE